MAPMNRRYGTFFQVLMVAITSMIYGGCSLDPNYVNRDVLAEIETIGLCSIRSSENMIYGMRYGVKPPNLYFEPKCKGTAQYTRKNDLLWVHTYGAQFRIWGLMSGHYAYYNMDIDTAYLWMNNLRNASSLVTIGRYGVKTMGSLNRVKRNNMACLRYDSIAGSYKSKAQAQNRRTIYQEYHRSLTYYCWPSSSSRHPISISSSTMATYEIPIEDRDIYYQYYALPANDSRRSWFWSEEDKYRDVEPEFYTDLEKEIFEPVFETLAVREIPEEIREQAQEKLHREWRESCEAGWPKITVHGATTKLPENVELYLKNCGYEQ